MNDPLPRDELASAYVDGDATADERAIVEADAALLARVRELRAVRQMLAVPVPTRSPADVDAAIAAALAADADVDDGPPAPAPTPLRPHPAGRRGRLALAVLGAAAAVVVVVVAVAALRPSDGSGPSASKVASVGGQPETAASTDGASDVSLAPSNAGASAPTAASGGATTTAGAPATSAAAATTAAAQGAPLSPPLNLGAIDDADSLRAALAAIPPTLRSAATSAEFDSSCTLPDAGIVAVAVWQGTPAFVFLDQANVATAVSQSTCAPLATVPLS